ncbi:MAG TPA: hypothetical protein VG675_03890 [Bryobacteraceae bacterium]|nr:hypothetical protein [Bryobacteraceae bacterium]
MAHPDLDRLLDYSLRFAQESLEKRGSFYPFAATVQPDGELKPVAVYSGEETPHVHVLLDMLSEKLKTLALKRETLATAVCYDSLVSPDGDVRRKTEAIVVSLEHADGESVIVYLPYSKKLFGRYNYSSLVAIAGERKHFPPVR